MTPLDKLASLPDVVKSLREGITLKELHLLARALTDVQAAEELNEARTALFRRVPARTAEQESDRAAGKGCGHVDDALARTGAVRGQRLRVAHRPRLRPHAHSLPPRLKNRNSRAPIHCARLQPIDPLRVADLRPLQAHT